jgi:hypothetical protein
MNLILYIAARLSPHSVLAAKLKSGNEEAMDIEDSQRLITEIEMLKVVLYLVRRERAVREEAS